MVHMWVNTVTGCGLPREEINGLRFGPPGGPGPVSRCWHILWQRSRARVSAGHLAHWRTLSKLTHCVWRGGRCARVQARERSSP